MFSLHQLKGSPELLTIEVSSSFHLPKFHITGLAGQEVGEARFRIRSAFQCSGFDFPKRRVTINLQPAHEPKGGTGLDLAMALGILAHSKGVSSKGWAAWGELGLGSDLRSVGQVGRFLYAAWARGCEWVVIGEEDAHQAAQVLCSIKEAPPHRGPPPKVIYGRTLKEVWEMLQSQTSRKLPPPKVGETNLPSAPPLELPTEARKWIKLCASGNHHLLIQGERGTGKSHTLQWLEQVFPPPSLRQRLRRDLLWELSETPSSLAVRVGTPTRATALTGNLGTRKLRIGPYTLAHAGLLIADEVAEWPRDCRESLREPLERGTVTLAHSHGHQCLPSQFTLAATANLCPCGAAPKNAVAL